VAILSIAPIFRRASDDSGEPPIREELFSVERLEQYAGELAAQHKIADTPQRGSLLLPRLEQNGRKLVETYLALAESIRSEHVISPAAEWLVDNFHIVEEQIREIREDLPKSYYDELPKLADGALKGYPRIYALSVALVAHTDSYLDSETLRRFINAYQKVAPLSIGELWAVPITLRLALVENLRRLATRIVSARAEREEADKLADTLLETAQLNPQEIVPLISGRFGKRKTLGRAFVVQLMQRLREQDPQFCLRLSGSRCVCTSLTCRSTIPFTKNIEGRPGRRSPWATSSRACACSRHSSGAISLKPSA